MMRLLLTGAASQLGQHLADGLRPAHDLCLTERTDMETDLDFTRCELGHDESTDKLVAGVEAIVHSAYVGTADEPASVWLDNNTRCTYNLLTAAAAADVGRVVFLSTLDMFRAYDFDMTVTEEWRPRPTCESAELGPYMGEFVAREFAHSGAMEVVIIRLGHVITADKAVSSAYDPMWVDARDAVGAVKMAVEEPAPQYGVMHLQHQSERGRFRSGGRRSSAYVPQHGFEEHP
jgi:nucleoside-diphosphate-sugar epimerase